MGQTLACIPLLYGSTTGNTERVAQKVAELWGGSAPVKLVDISQGCFDSIQAASCVLIAAPTWDFGELQQDWHDYWSHFVTLDFSAKRVALFGVGDQLGYPDYFQDAMGLVAEQVNSAGGRLVAPWPNEDYEFNASLALDKHTNCFVGLALDEDSQSWATDDRLARWLPIVEAEFNKVV